MERLERNEVAAELSRRQLLQRGGTLGLGALVLSSLPVVERMAQPDAAFAQSGEIVDATLQAVFDTIVPGRPATRTDLGNVIHAGAIAGVDSDPGAVEADSLLLAHHPKIGFDALAPAFLFDLEGRALNEAGGLGVITNGLFLGLSYEKRERVAISGLDFANPDRVLWEAAAAIPFTAFCAAATQRDATQRSASGYKVMRHPGTAPRGYRGFSYRKRLAREQTKTGYLP